MEMRLNYWKFLFQKPDKHDQTNTDANLFNDKQTKFLNIKFNNILV